MHLEGNRIHWPGSLYKPYEKTKKLQEPFYTGNC